MQHSNFNPQACNGTILSAYLAHKGRGGRSFERGHSYESKFAVKEIAKLLLEYSETGVIAKIESQKQGYFVDDLVIEYGDRRVVAWQLKNVQQLAWGSGQKGDLGFDFFHQLKSNVGRSLTVGLAVSNSDIASKLENQKPSALKDCLVEHFPDHKFTELVKIEPLKSALSSIAKDANPSSDLLVQIGQLLESQWWINDGSATIDKLLPAGHLPKLLKSFRSDEEAQAQLELNVREILDLIPDFHYSIERGFFHCSYLGTKSSLGFDCFSPKFQAFKNWILSNRPTEFEGNFEDLITVGCGENE